MHTTNESSSASWQDRFLELEQKVHLLEKRTMIVSNNFFMRALAVWGHWIVIQLIIGVTFWGCLLMLGLLIGGLAGGLS